jgi:hypothetical protein
VTGRCLKIDQKHLRFQTMCLNTSLNCVPLCTVGTALSSAAETDLRAVLFRFAGSNQHDIGRHSFHM